MTARAVWMLSLSVSLAPVVGTGVAAQAAPASARRPAFELGTGRVLVMAAIPEVLSNAEVKPRLASGLTTSFAFEITAAGAGGRRLEGGALVEIRYELWDEVYLVSASGAGGWQRHETLPSLERLLAWWRGLKLPVLAAGDRLAAGPWQLSIELSVIPFSRAEQGETQSWLSRSLADQRTAPSLPGETTPPAANAAAPLGGVLDLLVSTSIKRRSVVTFEWRSELRVGPAGAVAEHRP